MRAMILAAGLGERMRPLTDHTPKPLLRAAGTPLMEYHLRALAAAGCREIVVNVSHLADQITGYFGDGSRWGVAISYSHEPQPLETAGGIQRALPLLGEAPFLVVNGDIWTDYPLAELAVTTLGDWEQARLVMVDNRPHHPLGDFCLSGGRLGFRSGDEMGLTYAGIALFRPTFFGAMTPGKLALRPLLDAAIAAGALGGCHHRGAWTDVGTPQRLQELEAELVSAAEKGH